MIVFTTNCAGKIPARLRDRCERLTFEGSALLLRPALQEMTNRVWREEGCPGEPPDVETLDVFDGGNASFRRLLQALTPRIRAALAGLAGPRPAPAPVAVAPVAVAAVAPAEAPPPAPPADDADRLHSFGRRWAAGEKLGALAREHGGLTWQQLCGKLWTLGYRSKGK
ncbi:MAG TPA: hypothetical protein VKD72_14350 [Gemmataceae bacterium]|nr:hypothetical protein [Gemmataceae bacterium]